MNRMNEHEECQLMDLVLEIAQHLMGYLLKNTQSPAQAIVSVEAVKTLLIKLAKNGGENDDCMKKAEELGRKIANEMQMKFESVTACVDPNMN